MSRPFDLEIITPKAVVFNGKVTSLSCPGAVGRFQILYNHAPFLSSLDIGEMKLITESGDSVSYSISGGVTHVLKNKTMVLADTAENAKDIDIARAEESRARADSRLKSDDPSVDIERTKLSLLRALNRIKIATGT
jgi:F-type H+-transporting ATPase subunit epsilon